MTWLVHTRKITQKMRTYCFNEVGAYCVQISFSANFIIWYSGSILNLYHAIADMYDFEWAILRKPHLGSQTRNKSPKTKVAVFRDAFWQRVIRSSSARKPCRSFTVSCRGCDSSRDRFLLPELSKNNPAAAFSRLDASLYPISETFLQPNRVYLRLVTPFS